MSKASGSDEAAEGTQSPVLSRDVLPGAPRKKKRSHGSKKAKEETKSSAIKAIGYSLATFIGMFFVVYFIMASGKTTNDPESLYKSVLAGKVDKENYVYNNFVFFKYNNLTYTKLQKGGTVYNVPFRYGPRDVEYIRINGDLNRFGRLILENYTGEFYITFNPEGQDLKYEALATGEISLNVVKTLGMTPTAACTVNATGCQGSPILDCSTADKPTIHLVQEDDPMIAENGNCLVLQGKGYDLVKAADRLLFVWYQIMKAS
jgi:hypothetical protein